jgi:hypothetical protein
LYFKQFLNVTLFLWIWMETSNPTFPPVKL